MTKNKSLDRSALFVHILLYIFLFNQSTGLGYVILTF